jgi:hypothetical protein
MNTGFRRRSFQRAAGTKTQTVEDIMKIIELLKNFFITLFSGKTTGPASHPTGSEAEGNKAGTGGLETRCINPDYGCPFEMS